MSKDIQELRERAETGELTEEDVAYLNAREGIGTYDAIRNTADDAVFDEGDEDEGEEGYAALTVDELRDELKARDLTTTGNKAELVERLEADDEE